MVRVVRASQVQYLEISPEPSSNFVFLLLSAELRDICELSESLFRASCIGIGINAKSLKFPKAKVSFPKFTVLLKVFVAVSIIETLLLIALVTYIFVPSRLAVTPEG